MRLIRNYEHLHKEGVFQNPDKLEL
jgi:hypothetical protein